MDRRIVLLVAVSIILMFSSCTAKDILVSPRENYSNVVVKEIYLSPTGNDID